MEKPTIIALSVHAKKFVEDHFSQFITCIKVIFPMVLIVGLLKQLPKEESLFWVDAGLMFVTLCLHAFLCLRWSRVCLSTSVPVVPKNNILFLAGFIVLTGMLGGFFLGLEKISLAVAFEGTMQIVFLIAEIIAIALAMTLFLRCSFWLSGQADGKTLTLPATFALSRKTTMPLLGATILWSLFFIIGLTVYTLVVGLIVNTLDSGMALKSTAAITIGFFLSIPIHFAILLYNAIITASIVRCYQWGMQNNPL